MAQQSDGSALRTILNPGEPLGPIDAATINEIRAAALLFDPHNTSFTTLLRADVAVIIGRRGSGKTALLGSYEYRNYSPALKDPNLRRSTAGSDYLRYNIILSVPTHTYFDVMRQLVNRAAALPRPVESVIEDWTNLIADYFLEQFLRGQLKAQTKSPHLGVIQTYFSQDEDDFQQEARIKVWGRARWRSMRDFLRLKPSEDTEFVMCEEAIRAADRHLAATEQRLLILFDSMDDYYVTTEPYARTLGALIRFVGEFNKDSERMTMKLGLPAEIYPEIKKGSANPIKDLVRVGQLKWTSPELAQIAAYRFRLFLYLYDSKYAERLRDLDLSKRGDVNRFWRMFLPLSHTNKYGQEEEPLTYILRHTQLLPRQFLMIVQEMIKNSAEITGGYRELKSESLESAVEDAVQLLASEILAAYAHVFPGAEEIGLAMFANCDTVLTFDQLGTLWRRKGRAAAKGAGEMGEVQAINLLLRIGVVGLLETETERYYEATFAYDARRQLNAGEGQRLCVHPIFSRVFRAGKNPGNKAVLARGVPITWEPDDV